MNGEQITSSPYVGVTVQVGYGKLIFEIDPKALQAEMVKRRIRKLASTPPETTEDIPEIAQRAAQRGVPAFFANIHAELSRCAVELMMKYDDKGYEEELTYLAKRYSGPDEKAHLRDVTHITRYNADRLNEFRAESSNYISGTPPKIKAGRPPKSEQEKEEEWKTKRHDLIQRYEEAIALLSAKNKALSNANIARIAYPKPKWKVKSAPPALAQDVKTYRINLSELRAQSVNKTVKLKLKIIKA
jgi:hypothetical protein